MSYLQRNSATTEQRLKYRFSMLRTHAAHRGVTFTLTFEDIRDMWAQQRGKCALTGQRMFLTVGRGFLYRNCTCSVDRLDPKGGYTKDNVILARYDANRRKANRDFWTADYLEHYPEQVARVLQLKPNLNAIAA